MSGPPLSEIRREAAGCTACDLYARATQTVFGEGPPDARMMLVGEQPGDHEDREGFAALVRDLVAAAEHLASR